MSRPFEGKAGGFLMLSRRKEGSPDDLHPRGAVGYHRCDRNAILKHQDTIDAPDLGLETTSIPDPWAQLLKLAQSLTSRDTRGELPPQLLLVRQQWRGLLALVVLRRELKIESDLAFHRVFPVDANGAPAHHGMFLRVARQVLPDEFTKTKLGWSSIHAITFRGLSLGCSSPLTFVCPAATTPSATRSNASVPEFEIPGCDWFRNGVFTDPIGDLEGSLLHVLEKWLESAKTALAPSQDGTRGDDKAAEDAWRAYREAVRADVLRDELASFKTDVARKIALRGTPASKSHEEIDHRFRMEGTVQQCIQTVIFTDTDITKDEVGRSPFLLKPAPGATPAKQILLIGSSLVNLPDFDKGKVEVLRGVTLNRALNEYERGHHTRLRTLNIEHCEIYHADEIFCDRIFVSRGERTRADNAFPGAHSYPGVSTLIKEKGTDSLAPILPLRSAFISQFTPEYLCEHASFSGSEKEITVSINLNLNVPGRTEGRAIRFSKTYRQAANDIEFGRLPEVRIWPEFQDLKDWGAWYTYYNDLSVPGNKLLISPRRDSYDSAPHTVIVDASDKKKRIEVYQCSSFPRIFECRQGQDEFGILLAKAVEIKGNPRSGPWEIGVDFGTTGTSIYHTRNNGKPENLPLRPHVLSLTSAGAAESYEFFLPTEDENIDGILSIFKDFQGNQGGRNAVVPFVEGHISFVDRSKILGETDDPLSEGICADMKWGDPLDIERGKAFLKQLCLLTALQAKVAGAESIRWVFSYPLSFSRDRYDVFRRIWGECTDFALAKSGLNPTGGKAFRERDESACAAKYAHAVHQANIGEGVVILDVGGGSADISIWRREKIDGKQSRPIHNTSVKFAGRDIFQRPLMARPSLLSHFVNTDHHRKFVKTLAENKALMRTESIFFSQVDALFKIESQSILQLLSSKHKEPEVGRFLGILGLGLHGLFFYTGILLGILADKKRFDQRLPDVIVCGNGGKILHWLNFGKFEQGSGAEARLLESLRAGANFPAQEDVEAYIVLSAEPKTEAAYGMLVDPGERPERFEERPSEVVAGEAFTLGETNHGPRELIPFHELAEGPFTVSPELPMTTAFWAASKQPPLSNRMRADIAARTNDRLAEIVRRRNDPKADDTDSRKAEEQPIFIVVLDEIIKQATRDWAAGKAPWWR